MSLGYDEALTFLYGRLNYEQQPMGRYTPEAMPLGRMQRLLAALGNPHLTMPAIHIAGTKGKGSTAALVAEALRASGRRTGLYTSPHLERIEERIGIDGHLVAPERFVTAVGRLKPIVAQLDARGERATFFELVTALGWMLFRESGVEVAVIEVGLGGRLDSTNICQPVVTAITSISLDHTRQLGSTPEAIAGEKAGIAKPGVPMISGVPPGPAAERIAEVCRQVGAPLWALGQDFAVVERQPSLPPTAQRVTIRSPRHPDGRAYPLALLGPHQATNAAVAVRILDELAGLGWSVDPSAIDQAFATTQVPGRCELVAASVPQVLDVAHNAASIAALLDTLDEVFPGRRPVVVLALSREKDTAGMLAALAGRVERLFLTAYQSNPRALSAEALELAVRGVSPPLAAERIDGPPLAAWQAACRASQPGQPVVITGSTFLVAELRSAVLHAVSARQAV